MKLVNTINNYVYLKINHICFYLHFQVIIQNQVYIYILLLIVLDNINQLSSDESGYGCNSITLLTSSASMLFKKQYNFILSSASSDLIEARALFDHYILRHSIIIIISIICNRS